MKFTLATVLLAAAGISAVAAQDPASSSSSSAPASAAPSSSSAAAPSSSAAAGGGGGDSEDSDGSSSSATATCTALVGDPKVHAFDCPEGAVTSTPPYDSASLQAYLISAYTPDGKQGYHYSEVASELADTVREYYPTLTVSYSDIVHQYATALSGEASPDGAVSAISIPRSLGSVAVVGAALVAGGAFIL